MSSEEDEQSDGTYTDLSDYDIDNEEHYDVHGHHYMRKLGHDLSPHYWGDGGQGSLEYPVYYCRSLFRVVESDDNDCRRNLTDQLRLIDRYRRDVQPNNVVHDIIDPSLNARVVSAPERLALSTQWEADFKRRTFQTCDAVRRTSDKDWRHVFHHHEGSGKYEQVPEDKRSAHQNMHDTRSAFQWVPTEVQLQCSSSPRNRRAGNNDEGDLPTSAKFMGPIPGLPDRVFCESVYANLEAVFSAALPLLDKVLPLQQNNTKLQVVVKAQEYVQPPHSKYTGRWHTEGYSENIVAGVVYYLDVSEETTGGALSFRPRQTPALPYSTSDSRDSDEVKWSRFVKNVPIRTGTAVAFANSIPHRFRSIRNDTDHAQRRLFLNFFVVDPATPLANTTTTLMGPWLGRRVLTRMGVRDESNNDGSNPIISTILDYYGGYACALHINRKLLRDRARSAMAQDRPHWYETMHFGNSADLLYTGDARPMVPLIESLTQHYDYAAPVRDIEHSGANTAMLGSGM